MRVSAWRKPVVAQRDRQTAVEERQLPQPPLENREVVFDLGEGAGGRLERDLRSALLGGRPDHRQRLHRVAMFEADAMLDPVAPDAHDHPLGQRIDHRRAHAVQPARDLVGVLVELAARMQPGQHHLRRRDAFLGVDVGRDAAAVVAHGDAAVAVQHQVAACRVPRLRLVHRVVDDLERHVMQAGAIIGVADIHARSLAHGFEAAEDGDRRAVVIAAVALR